MPERRDTGGGRARRCWHRRSWVSYIGGQMVTEEMVGILAREGLKEERWVLVSHVTFFNYNLITAIQPDLMAKNVSSHLF